MIDFYNLTHCPCCNGVLQTDFIHGNAYAKGCKNRIDHWWEYVEDDPFWRHSLSVVIPDANPYVELCIDMRKRIYLRWYLRDKRAWVTNNGFSAATELPWIEPDFSNYRKFVKKLRTLVVFS